MRARAILRSLVVSLTLALAGCGSLPARPELPEDLGGRGLLVGQVAGIRSLALWESWAELLVDGRTRKGAFTRSYIALPMKPGTYTVTGLFRSAPGGSSSFGSVTVTRTVTSTLPMRRTFTIEAGKATNLGLIVLVPDPKVKDGFYTFLVDNSADMQHFLRTFYPRLAAGLGGMSLAAGSYVQGEKLDALRRLIASEMAFWWSDRARAPYFAGPAGTLAEVRPARDRRASVVRLFAAGTMANVTSASYEPVTRRYGYTTSDGRLFVFENGQLTQKTVPTEIRSGKVHVLPDRGLVVTDDRFQIFTSLDNGDSWRAFLHEDQRRSTWVEVAIGRKGYFVYAGSGKPAAFYSEYGKADYRAVALPKGLGAIKGMTEAASGLFIDTEVSMWTAKTKLPLYFRPTGASEWETRHMPNATCRGLLVEDETGLRLRTVCGKETYQSADGGLTWRPA